MIQKVQAEIKFISSTQVHSSEAEPWMSQNTRSIPNPIVRFHNQIIDFANYVEPTPEEHESRVRIFSKFQAQLKKILPQALIMSPFLKNRLYLKSTQLQIYIMSPNQQQNWQQSSLPLIQSLQQKLKLKIYNLSVQCNEHQCRIIAEQEETNIQIWFRFVAYNWRMFLIDMDMCVSHSTQVKYLYYIFFCMVRQRSLHTAIKSLFIYGICSFFAYERRNQRIRTLTQNVIKFLEFFSIGIAQDKQRKIVYKQGNIYKYTMSTDKVLSFEIADKVDLASSRKVKQFFRVLQNRYRVLGNYYYPLRTSVLSHLVNPCSGKFYY